MGCVCHYKNSGDYAVGSGVAAVIFAFLAFVTPWFSMGQKATDTTGAVPEQKMLTNFFLQGMSLNAWSGSDSVIAEGAVYDWKSMFESDGFNLKLAQASAISIACTITQILIGLIAVGVSESARFAVFGRCCRSTQDAPGSRHCCRTVGRMPCNGSPVRAVKAYRFFSFFLLILSVISIATYVGLMNEFTYARENDNGSGVVTAEIATYSAGFAFQVISLVSLLCAFFASSKFKKNSQFSEYAANKVAPQV